MNTPLISEQDHVTLLSNEKLFGEDFDARMERFGLLVENATMDNDLCERDIHALRTANAIMHQQKIEIERLKALLEKDLVF